MSDYLKELFIDETKGALGKPVEIVGAKGSDTGCEIFNDYENNISSGWYAHAEGLETKAYGRAAHAEGERTQATGQAAHAEGFLTIASIIGAHAEGDTTQANGVASHAEGRYSKAQAEGSHAEGDTTQANGIYSHVQGKRTTSTYPYQDVVGCYNIVEPFIVVDSGVCEQLLHGRNAYAKLEQTPIFDEETGLFIINGGHTVNTTSKFAAGDIVAHIQDKYWNNGQNASYYYVIESYIKADRTTGGHIHNATKYSSSIVAWKEAAYAHIVGNGDAGKPSNAHTLDWSGNAWYAGKILVGGTGRNDENASEVATKAYVEELIGGIENGTY